jgi:molybdopterin-binding protein
MRLSIRNQLNGEIVAVHLGTVMATVQVRLDGGGQVVTASITKDAAEELGLAVGQAATVVIKSTDVAIGVEPWGSNSRSRQCHRRNDRFHPPPHRSHSKPAHRRPGPLHLHVNTPLATATACYSSMS